MSTLNLKKEDCFLESRPPWAGDYDIPHTPLYIGGTDPGMDPDDEGALLAGLGLGARSRGSVYLLGLVANHQPAADRAALIRGATIQLNRGSLPVVIGSGTPGSTDSVDNLPEYQFRCDYANHQGLMRDPVRHMLHTCEAAMAGSLTMIGLSRFTDLAGFLARHGASAQRAIKRLVVMSGVEGEGEVPKLVNGLLVPDSAQNNKYDLEAAKNFYYLAQSLGIPLTVVTRAAAGAAQVPRWVYDELAARSPVGQRLQSMQRDSIEDLWRRANMPPNDPKRLKLDASRDAQWFRDFFLGGEGKDRTGTDSIWDLVKGFALYDPLTVLAAIDRIKVEFMDPVRVATVAQYHASGTPTPVEHEIIGLTKKQNGIINPELMVKFLISTMFSAIEPRTK